MKYKIKNITVVKSERCAIFTSSIEEERKKIMDENPGFRVNLTYVTIEDDNDNNEKNA